MKYSLKNIVIAVLLTCLVAFGVYKIVTYKEPYFKQTELVKNNVVFNTTKELYLDTILHVGLNELGVEGVTIILKPLSEGAKLNFQEFGDLKAHIRYHEGSYYLFVGDVIRLESVAVIAHELIHLQQYQDRSLVVEGVDIPVWKGEVFDLTKVIYENRPWEKEAYEKQGDLEKRLKLILY